MSPLPDALAAALADRYRLERELGAGGMATVYLAHDLKHERQVALKVLHPDLAAALGVERFLAEIKTTARLQHPHILPLLDSGAAGGLLYYVMPFVAGESLRDRLRREKQLSIEDAVRIAREVADALAHAHAHGIIHRDIKPENILLQEGHAVVADFGIALAMQSAAGPRLTQSGLSLGTPQYMSPEQAMGERAIDARSDIFALGAVTYEMLTGEPPFTGATVQVIVAKLMHEPPVPITTIRETVPGPLEAVVLRALARLPADRFATASEFGAALTGQLVSGGSGGSGSHAMDAAVRREAERWRRVAVAMGAVAAIAIVAFAAALLFRRDGSDPSAPAMVRTTIRTGSLAMLSHASAPAVAISPDGRTLAYVSGAGREGQLMLRRLDAATATPVPNAEQAYSPFFSPDGEWLGYADASGGHFPARLKKRRLTDGAVFDLGPVTSLHGAAWTRDGRIVLGGTGEHRWAIAAIPEDGGQAEILARRDSLAGEMWLAWPILTPDGGHVVFTALFGGGVPGSLELLDLRSGQRRRLMQARDGHDGGGQAAITQDGFIILAADGVLRGAELDVANGRLRGEPVTLVPDVLMGLSGEPGLGHFAVGAEGTLVYVAGTRRELPSPEVTRWNDSLNGTSVLQARRPADEGGVMFGLGGLRTIPGSDGVVFSTSSLVRNPALVRWWDGAEVWEANIGSGSVRRIAPPRTYWPVPSPDGAWIYLNRLADTAFAASLHRMRRDGSGTLEEVVAASPGRLMQAYSLTRDGQLLFFQSFDTVAAGSSGDIYAVATEGDRAPRPVLTGPEHDVHPAISPDGRWLAWRRGASGKEAVLVAPWPALTPQVPLTGGRLSDPAWGHDGKSLYALDVARSQVVAVSVTGDRELRFGPPRAVSGSLRPQFPIDYGRAWDVDAQGRVYSTARNQFADTLFTRDLTVIANWGASLREQVRKR